MSEARLPQSRPNIELSNPLDRCPGSPHFYCGGGKVIETMLRRLTAILAILLTLASSLTWAYTQAVPDPAASTLGDPHAQSILDEGHCDHHCHAAAHLIALETRHDALSLLLDTELFSFVRHVRLTTRYPSPPREPPRL